MNQEETLKTQLAEERAKDRKIKPKTAKSTKIGLLKRLRKNPFAKLSIVSIGETFLGPLPFQTAFVIDAWQEEKKTGASPNPAEYITILILALGVDAAGAVLELTGVGIPIAKAITFPGLGLLWAWRLIRGKKSKS